MRERRSLTCCREPYNAAGKQRRAECGNRLRRDVGLFEMKFSEVHQRMQTGQPCIGDFRTVEIQTLQLGQHCPTTSSPESSTGVPFSSSATQPRQCSQTGTSYHGAAEV